MKWILCWLLLTSSSLGQLLTRPTHPEFPSKAMDVIIYYETGGKDYYIKFLQHPTVPGGASGITIGIGADCGAGYSSKEIFLKDWHMLIEADKVNLSGAVGLNHQRSIAYLPRVKHIVIKWNDAIAVFNEKTVSAYYSLACRTFPKLEELDLRCQVALLSVVFNRGGSLIGEPRIEMREIRRLVPLKDYKGIAHQLRKMKRVWRGKDIQNGMYNRREGEAKLVDECV